MKGLLILAALFSLSAFAQSTGTPCRADITNFCGGLTGRAKIVACLRQNAKDLSPTCKAQFAEAKAALKDCKDDMKKLCKTAGKGKGEMLKCLKENVAKLAPTCKAHVEKK